MKQPATTPLSLLVVQRRDHPLMPFILNYYYHYCNNIYFLKLFEWVQISNLIIQCNTSMYVISFY